ncbi:MAG TPA: hypothetical protein V6D17_19445 [Candidatus Obscuribacterales bacterium]
MEFSLPPQAVRFNNAEIPAHDSYDIVIYSHYPMIRTIDQYSSGDIIANPRQ